MGRKKEFREGSYAVIVGDGDNEHILSLTNRYSGPFRIERIESDYVILLGSHKFQITIPELQVFFEPCQLQFRAA